MFVDTFLIVGLIIIALLPVLGYLLVRLGFEEAGRHLDVDDQPY